MSIGGRPVQLRLRVRRFFCGNTACTARTFVAQVDGLTVRYGRVTMLLRQVLCAVAVAVAARSGVRLAARLGISVGRDTLLRLVRGLPDPPVAVLPCVGVDDFALRRGQVYGTVIVDMDSHRAVDVLADRTRDTFVEWLRAHPGVELVCRDRAGAYAQAVRTAAPDAVQVADRWHLWHNLIEAVEKTVIAERAVLCAPDSNPTRTSPQPHAAPASAANAVGAVADSSRLPGRPARVEGRLAARTRQRFTAVHDLRAAGRSISAIGRELHLQRKTVRRFARATTVEELLDAPRVRRGSVLDPYKAYLHDRFNDGCIDAVELTREITKLGYRGSLKTVRTYLHPFRAQRIAPAPVPVAPTVRQVTGWITRHPDRLTEDECLQLKQILARSAVLAATHRQVHEFAVMLTNRGGEHLEAWLHTIDAHSAAPLRGFARGVRADRAAVSAALTLDYSSGAVEGAVTRIKAIKRQMYGRAGFDLLRKRILHPA
jgi:transposase